jgi:hypothetical protein
MELELVGISCRSDDAFKLRIAITLTYGGSAACLVHLLQGAEFFVARLDRTSGSLARFGAGPASARTQYDVSQALGEPLGDDVEGFLAAWKALTKEQSGEMLSVLDRRRYMDVDDAGASAMDRWWAVHQYDRYINISDKPVAPDYVHDDVARFLQDLGECERS